MFVIGPDKKVKLILVYPMTTAVISTRCCAHHHPVYRQGGGDPGELEAARRPTLQLGI
jgi:hypothetical protein